MSLAQLLHLLQVFIPLMPYQLISLRLTLYLPSQVVVFPLHLSVKQLLQSFTNHLERIVPIPNRFKVQLGLELCELKFLLLGLLTFWRFMNSPSSRLSIHQGTISFDIKVMLLYFSSLHCAQLATHLQSVQNVLTLPQLIELYSSDRVAFV